MTSDWRDILGQLFQQRGGEGWPAFVDYLFVHLGPPGRGDFRESCRLAAEAFQRKQPDAAMEQLYSLCEHSLGKEPVLDLLDTRAAAHYLACDGYPGLSQVDKLQEEKAEKRWADALLMLGQPKKASSYFSPLDLHGGNGRGLAAALLGESRASIGAFRDALDLAGYGSVEQVPIRYNLAQQLFCSAHLHEAMAEFKRCRSIYPHYRGVLKWIGGLRQLLEIPSGPRGNATSLPVPYYSVANAVAENAG